MLRAIYRDFDVTLSDKWHYRAAAERSLGRIMKIGLLLSATVLRAAPGGQDAGQLHQSQRPDVHAVPGTDQDWQATLLLWSRWPGSRRTGPGDPSRLHDQ